MMSPVLRHLLSPLVVVPLLLVPVAALGQEEQKEEAAAGSFLDRFGMTAALSGTSGIDPVDALLSTSIMLVPSFKATENVSLSVRWDVEREWTNDDNDEQNEVLWTDVIVTLTHSNLAKIGDLVTFGGLARAYLPASESSQLLGLNTSLRLGGQAAVALGAVELTGRAYAHKNFHEYTTAGFEEAGASSEFDEGRSARPLATRHNIRDLAFIEMPADVAVQGTGRKNTAWSAIFALDLDVAATSNLNVFATWTLLNSHGYDTAPGACAEHGALPCSDTPGEDPTRNPGLDGDHQRFVQLFQAGIDYSLRPDLSLGVSYTNWPLPQRTTGSDFKYPWLFYWYGTNWTTVGVDLTYKL